MRDDLTASELGNEFEDFILNSLGNCDKVYNEKTIRHLYPYITTIDILVRLGNYMFPIQCKFKKGKVEANDVKAFVSDCMKLKNNLEKKYIYCPVYLTRVKNTRGGLEALSELNGENIYLYESEAYINMYNLSSNSKDFMTLLMKVHNYILSKTSIYITLKEWNSNDVLMAYLI